MPRISKQARAIKEIDKLVRKRLRIRLLRNILLLEDECADAVDLALFIALENCLSRRHLFRSGRYRKGPSENRFTTDLSGEAYRNLHSDTTASSSSEESIMQPWLNDEESLQKYRMSRNSFHKLLDKIKDHQVFHTAKRKKKQAPPAFQLMTFLRYIGTEGSGASNANQRNTFGIGYGTATAYRERVTTVIRSLSKEYIRWPDPEERKKISMEMLKQYGFPHCVMIADGTPTPLAFEPETEDAPDYSGRKYGYSLTAMIFSDHKRRIRHYLARYPGFAHDNRVFKASKPAIDPAAYFAPREYCIGDSAFENSWFMVSAFKKPKGESIPVAHEKFNEKLARKVSLHLSLCMIYRSTWEWECYYLQQMVEVPPC
jgi:DDE superfamily endonuclease